jgi:signal transduction histidine kinase
MRIITPAGEEKWVADCSVSILDEKTGEVIGSLGILQDITERKWAEKVLKEYTRQLEDMVEARAKELKDIQEQLVRSEKLAVLGQLAGGVGHELRRPLSVMNNAVYFLKDILKEADDKVREYLSLIAEEIQDAERIMSGLLDFSRAKSADKQQAALSKIVGAVLDKNLPPQGIQVASHFPGDLPCVKVDPGQISQVLINLIHNAYEAMPEGGHLTISALSEKESVRLRVADTGCGISRDNMKKIFEPLFTTKKCGIGLGLAISKNLMEANGGRIEIQSEEGKGSVFTMIFPATG